MLMKIHLTPTGFGNRKRGGSLGEVAQGAVALGFVRICPSAPRGTWRP